MSGFSAKANELLVEIYRNVQILEQNELKKQRLNISINEMHMIELIAKGKTGMTVSEIAQQLKVTKPSVTVAVNKLVQKGYCEKQRLPGDGRAVQVMLTPEGKKSGGVPPPLPPAHHCGDLRGSFGRGARGASAHHDAHQFLFSDEIVISLSFFQ